MNELRTFLKRCCFGVEFTPSSPTASERANEQSPSRHQATYSNTTCASQAICFPDQSFRNITFFSEISTVTNSTISYGAYRLCEHYKLLQLRRNAQPTPKNEIGKQKQCCYHVLSLPLDNTRDVSDRFRIA